jgi:membrane protease YdiL (CAAX protease family)
MTASDGSIVGKNGQGKISAPLLIVLNLLPGLILGGCFLLLSGVFARHGLSGYLALLVLIPICLAPIELGIMLFWSVKFTGSKSFYQAVAYRRKGTVADYLGLPIVLFLGVLLILLVIQPISQYLASHLTFWLPVWATEKALIAGLANSSPTQRSIIFGLAVLLSGFVAPAVEELYNRGFLLPRMEHWGWKAPILNALLFALQHFYFPANVPAVFFAFIPISCVAMIKKDWRIGWIVHCLINLWGLFSLSQILSGNAFWMNW